MTNYNEIDNPLPDQVMRQMDADAEASRFEDYCNEQSKQLCEENDVHKDLIEDFQEWYHSYYCEHKDEVPVAVSAEDVDLIDDWWDQWGHLFDDYNSPFNVDPTPQHLYDNTGGEPPISAEERDRNSLDSKRESHGHRYYSNTW